MIKIPELGIEVFDVHGFNYKANEILERFTDALCGEYTEMYDPEAEDMEHLAEVFTHFYTIEGIAIIAAERDRLFDIGCKYFYIQDIDIINDAITEP